MSSDQDGCSSTDLNWIESDFSTSWSVWTHHTTQHANTVEPYDGESHNLRKHMKNAQLITTTFKFRMLVLLPLLLASPMAMATKMPNRKLLKNNFQFLPITINLTGMELLQTQTTLLATLKTRRSNVWTSTATSQLLGMMARFKTVIHQKRMYLTLCFQSGGGVQV